MVIEGRGADRKRHSFKQGRMSRYSKEHLDLGALGLTAGCCLWICLTTSLKICMCACVWREKSAMSSIKWRNITWKCMVPIEENEARVRGSTISIECVLFD